MNPIHFTIKDSKTGGPCSGWIEIEERGVGICFDGYGVAAAADGAPVFVEFREGTPRVHCWPDINNEDETTIELGGAAEWRYRDAPLPHTTLACCPVCKSSRVQSQVWARTNTGEVLDDTERYHWCDACEVDGGDGEIRYQDLLQLPASETREAQGASGQGMIDNCPRSAASPSTPKDRWPISRTLLPRPSCSTSHRALRLAQGINS